MMTLWGHRSGRSCDGISRRDFLKIGGLGLGGLCLSDMVGAAPSSPRPKSVILLVLAGGMSHIDTWDMKPDAPVDYRGDFKPIHTKVPGLDLCEHFPKQAAIADQFSIVRGIRSVHNDHFLAEVYTGLHASQNRPAFGSVVSRLREEERAKKGGSDGNPLPAYVCLHEPAEDRFEFEKPHYAGSAHAPFRPFGQAVQNLSRCRDIVAPRLDDRKELLRSFDTLRRDLDARAEFAGIEQSRAKAFDLLNSPAVRDAFDLTKEPDKVRLRYPQLTYTYATPGLGWDCRRVLLARRLVEAGVPVVTLRLGTWDHHGGDLLTKVGGIFGSLKTMLPALDHTIHTLLTDLTDRGLDKDVAVIVLGEFGRTPRLSPGGPGREHWADAGAALVYGGGLKKGQVIGQTDSKAEYAKSGSITFQNIVATIYRLLGIDPLTAMRDFNGRPIPLLDDGAAIAGLMA